MRVSFWHTELKTVDGLILRCYFSYDQVDVAVGPYTLQFLEQLHLQNIIRMTPRKATYDKVDDPPPGLPAAALNGVALPEREADEDLAAALEVETLLLENNVALAFSVKRAVPLLVVGFVKRAVLLLVVGACTELEVGKVERAELLVTVRVIFEGSVAVVGIVV